jgi:hypothetical protein
MNPPNAARLRVPAAVSRTSARGTEIRPAQLHGTGASVTATTPERAPCCRACVRRVQLKASISDTTRPGKRVDGQHLGTSRCSAIGSAAGRPSTARPSRARALPSTVSGNAGEDRMPRTDRCRSAPGGLAAATRLEIAASIPDRARMGTRPPLAPPPGGCPLLHREPRDAPAQGCKRPCPGLAVLGRAPRCATSTQSSSQACIWCPPLHCVPRPSAPS